MKRMKFKLNKFKDKLINQVKKVKEEHLIKRYIKNNTYYIFISSNFFFNIF